ncbi:MAG TPA: CBS domain-containing protein [Nitrososphaeraceae archaeon]|jgi:predicted transcriptional regulator|nr:CBS domain-containing protein [Nitrososphaeraceae archaeon]
MLPRLEYVKQARLRLGITQRKLASLSGISTSMVNQIESGRCKPSYETGRRIFEVLSSLESQSSVKAGEICTRRLISAQKHETLQTAINKMRNNSISQIPVFDGSRLVGIVSEDRLAKSIVEKDERSLLNMRISMVMEPPPPVVDISIPAKALIPLVRFAKCILVSEKAEVIGIITITDTLKMVES